MDGWRGFSILAVIIGHFFPIPGLNFGRVGVEMFFVLSGRLMGQILFIDEFPLKEFVYRRITRVWPALVVLVCTMLLMFHRYEGLRVGLVEAISALTFTINYVSLIGYHPPVLEHIWSLSVEEHTYLILLLLAFIVRNCKIRLNATLITISIASAFMLNGLFQSIILAKGYYEVYWRTDVRAASILMSVAIYLYLYKNNWVLKHKFTTYAPGAFFLVGMLLNINIFPDWVKYSAGSMCFALAVCTIDKSPRFLISILEHPVLIRMGLWSYSIYLWQQPFFKLIGPVTVLEDNIIVKSFLRFGLLIIAYIFAILNFYYFEQPVRQFLNTCWKRKAFIVKRKISNPIKL